MTWPRHYADNEPANEDEFLAREQREAEAEARREREARTQGYHGPADGTTTGRKDGA